jgi:hypothetical protein
MKDVQAINWIIHTENEGPVRIQYKCLVPTYVFPEMKLCSLSFPILTLIYLIYLWEIYRVAAINPDCFSLSFFYMTQHSWKTSDFIEVKTNMQRYKSRIILFIKTADSLDPGPQALTGLRHGVPVEGPHHLLYLLDQILGFVARLCNDP